MTVLGSHILAGASGQGGYNLTNSLRFRSSVSAYLNRTPASTSSRTTWTWSGWVKLGRDPDGFFALFGADANGYPCSGIALTNYNIQYFSYTHPVYDWQKISTMVLRDHSAWYHIVAVTDTTNGTAEDRARVYVNGQRVTSWSTNNNPSPSFAGYVNSSSYVTKVGRVAGFGYFDGYMSEVNFIDGLALDPSSFGETSTSTGVWIPKKYVGTYGTNGFYLDFEDNSSTAALGYDAAGSNDFTVNNISLTTGATYDSMKDVPTLTSVTQANYAVMNPLDAQGTATLTDANLTLASSSTTHRNRKATFVIPSTGKWYWELTTASTCSSSVILGWGLQTTAAATDSQAGNANTWMAQNDANQDIWNQTTNTLSTGSAVAGGSIRQVAYDADSGKLWFGINDIWYSSTDLTSGNPSAGTNPCITLSAGSYFPTVTCYNLTANVNFGQRPFAYTPPTGFKALNTFNLTTPTIIQANKYFDTVIWTGDQTNKQIPLNFTADFVWAKRRSNSDNHVLYDAIRGINKGLNSNVTSNTESTNDYGLDFDNGNYLAIDGTKYFGGGGGSGITFVAWNWEANGTGVSNTQGSITSTVSANTAAGFSIVTYTGNNTSGATVGHGLGVAPSMVILKSRSLGTNWYVYHSGLSSALYQMYLNLASGQDDTGITALNDKAPTDTLLELPATGYGSNNNGETYVAYCFAQIDGYSKIGTYVGNGDPNGAFIYTGFRPRYLMIKSRSEESWELFDTTRSPYNQAVALLEADAIGGENTSSTSAIDILSNGFKHRNTRAATNASSTTYVYLAFAETPFKYANAR